VVLIVAISLGGYVAYKFFGAKAGVVLAGLLGGLISSTATTVSYSRRVRQTPGNGGLAAFVIMVASAVVFARVLVLVAAVAPASFGELVPPVVAVLGAAALISVVMWLRGRHKPVEMPPHANPTELKSALWFGVLFGVVTFAVAAAREQFGARGLYVVAVLSGLTDMDAITLSTAQIVKDGQLMPATGWRIILTAALSNLVFKAAIAAVLGDRHLFRRIAVVFALTIGAGVAVIVWWP